MRYLICLLLVLVLAGCNRDPQPERREIIIEQPKSQPPVIQVLPPAPSPAIPPSAYFLEGYNDGYYDNWLSPFRYAFNNDYRSGRSAGLSDRQKGLPHRFKGR